MKIEFEIEDKWMEDLNRTLELDNFKTVSKALSLLKWMVDNSVKRKYIGAFYENDQDGVYGIQRLSDKELNWIRGK